MKKPRSCEEQIAYVPRVAKGGTLAVVVFRQIGVAETLLLFTNRKRATLYANFDTKCEIEQMSN